MSKQLGFDKIDILGVDIDIITNAEALTAIMELSAPHQPATYIVQPYVEFLDKSYRDLEVRELLDNAELCLADGVALVWAAAYLYAGPRTLWRFGLSLMQIIFQPTAFLYPLTSRGAGINFTLQLLEVAAQTGRRVAVVGGPSSQSIEATATTIRQKWPHIEIVYTHHGTDEHALKDRQSTSWLSQLAGKLAAQKPDIVLLGLGFPRQEYAAAYLAAHLDHGVFIGEGGSFDYQALGGNLVKAPRWLQISGLEWLWRLLLQPSRWRRQMAIPRFMWRVWRQSQQ